MPSCEFHPLEAVKTNILGTKNVSETAIKYKTKIMVLISTDKAVDPTNFMGASKRAAEIYIQNLDKENSITNFDKQYEAGILLGGFSDYDYNKNKHLFRY